MAENFLKKEEVLTHFRREDIKTMEKDVAAARGIEARAEREKIVQSSYQQPELKKEVKDIVPGPKDIIPEPPDKLPVEQTTEQKPPQLPKKLRSSKKILVRGFIILIFLALILLAVKLPWDRIISFDKIQSFFIKPNKVEEVQPNLPEENEPLEFIAPASLIAVQDTIISEINEKQEAVSALNQVLNNQEAVQNSLSQIILKYVPENRTLTLDEVPLIAVFGAELLPDIYPKLEKDYTLALYSQTQGPRAMFVGKVKESQGLIDLLKSWEAEIIKNDIIIDQEKIQPLVPYFRTSFYKDIGLRYLTLSKDDWGICYAYFEDYFVITSSLESFKKVIDNIPSKPDEKLGQLFIVGFDGTSLTPQLESFFKQYQPGGILLLSKNIQNADQLKKLISDLQNLSLTQTGLPLLVAVDQEGDPISRISFLEEKTSQSEITTTEQAFLIGQKRGQELKELGINLNLAPLLDLSQEGDFLYSRSFQKSAQETGELAKAMIQGQEASGILTAIKHFPGYNTISVNPEEVLSKIAATPETSQFVKAMEANPQLVMAANVVYQDIDSLVPLTFSALGIQFLKEKLGTNPLIISDDLDQNSLLENFTLKEIITKPIEAGIDLMILSGWRNPTHLGLDAFWSAFEKDEIFKIMAREAVDKIINFKQANL
jgi:beta-N-acetylhexosaminidase